MPQPLPNTMNAVHICLNYSTCQSSCNVPGFFNIDRLCISARGKKATRISSQRVVTACLNVGAEAPTNAVKLGKKTKEVIESEAKFLVGTYARVPIVLERGEGCKLYDVEGKEYLDLNSGIAVNALGHGDADFLKALNEQAKMLIHVSNVCYSLPQVWAYAWIDLLVFETHCF